MKYTFKQFKAEYPDDAACLDKIMDARYGGREFTCPSCGADTKYHRIAKRRAYACQHCGHHIYPCVGTPFEKSRTPLTDWFFAMYLMTSTRHGVAAKELERQIGCTYKTAWRMAHELRKLMAQSDSDDPMGGHVEIDESYIGGRKSGKRRKGEKTLVFGMVERQGIVRAGPIAMIAANHVEPIIMGNVIRGSTISTDERRAYSDLRRSGYQHGTVTHSRKEYVQGKHHTNTIEGYWAQLKRSIRGTHIHVSAKHLPKYIAEFSYRLNWRFSHAAMFSRLIWGISQPRLAAD